MHAASNLRITEAQRMMRWQSVEGRLIHITQEPHAYNIFFAKVKDKWSIFMSFKQNNFDLINNKTTRVIDL